MYCVADDRHRRPLADRGSPGRTHGNAVTNPRIRVCSTVVLTALPPAPRTGSILPQPVPDNGLAHPHPTSVATNIRVNCVADDRHRRPLADRGSPGRTHGNAVTNPRIRVCSTVVLTALPPAPLTGPQ